MDWTALISPSRFGAGLRLTGEKAGSRTEFETDIDKITYSAAFRRLGRKTQVHPLAANDHVHTRLTHSLEVSRVGNALGKELGIRLKSKLPAAISEFDLASIVSAACLAHDIGNPPFGHAGEEAMKHWFDTKGSELLNPLVRDKYLTRDEREDLGLFEGNAQGLRILTQTENHLFDGGLHITYSTLGAFLKYPQTSAKRTTKGKFCAYRSEHDVIEEIAKELGLHQTSDGLWSRHPLAFLVEAADDICYAIIDLEDAVELDILSYSDVCELMLSVFDPEEKADVLAILGPSNWFRVNLSRLRGKVFERLVLSAVDGFMNKETEIMAGAYSGSLFEALETNSPTRLLIDKANETANRKIFPDSKKVEIELGSFAVFDTLLTAFVEAAIEQADVLSNKSGGRLGWKSSLVLRLLGDHAPKPGNAPKGHTWNHYQCIRRVIDFVSGMTDNYAVYISSQIQGMGFSGVQRP